jgi:type IV secretory pathway TrbL component
LCILLLLLLLLLLIIIIIIIIIIITGSGYVLGGSGTTIHNTMQYNTQKTYTLKTIHNAIITNTMHKRKQEYKAGVYQGCTNLG